jgi:hypothetical protein
MKKLLIFLCVTLFLLNVAPAQPPSTTILSDTKALNIFITRLDYHKQNQPYNFNAHVTNTSSGFQYDNTDLDCFLHLYDNTGNHTAELNFTPNPDNDEDYYAYVNGGNFSSVGLHRLHVYCEIPGTIFGGSIDEEYYVTPSGQIALSDSEGLVSIASLFTIFLCAGFFYLFSYRLNAQVGKIAFIVLSSILMLTSVFYSMVLVQEYTGLFHLSTAGFEAFFYVMLVMAGISFTAFMIFAILVSIKIYKFKRGWID